MQNNGRKIIDIQNSIHSNLTCCNYSMKYNFTPFKNSTRLLNSEIIPSLILTNNLNKDNDNQNHHEDFAHSENYSIKINQSYINNIDRLISNIELELNINNKIFMERSKSRFLTRFLQAINENYMNPDFGRQQAAKILNVSERHLNRTLKQYHLLNFSRFLKKTRLKNALLLINQGLQVVQIGEMVGFSSTSYFCSCFKEAFHETVSSMSKRTIQHKSFIGI